MLIYIIVCVALITQTYSLHTEHCHNRVVRRKTEYRVNISMPDNDNEMVDDDNLVQFSNKGIILNKTHKKPHRTLQTRNLVTTYNNTIMYPKVIKSAQNLSQIDFISARNDSYSLLTKSNYSDAKSEEKSKETFHTVEIDAEKSELEKQANPLRITRETSACRIWNIVQIWLIIYCSLAIPLWCTIGRCCCCLVCKCFRARETIREAKQYAMWNPPGVLRKKTGDFLYTPSEKEKEAYEELEHLIRTL